MRKLTSYSIATLWLAIVCSFSASAVTFEVTTAEEFQAALSAAASNGGDDEIIVAVPRLSGKFVFRTEQSNKLAIIGKGDIKPIFEQGYLDFVALSTELVVELSNLHLKSFAVRVPREKLKQFEIQRLTISDATSNFSAEELSISNSEIFNVNLLSEWPARIETLRLLDTVFEADLSARAAFVEIDNSKINGEISFADPMVENSSVTVSESSIVGSLRINDFQIVKLKHNSLEEIAMTGDMNEITHITGNVCTPEKGLIFGDKRRAVEFISNKDCYLFLRQNFDALVANNVSPEIEVLGLNIDSQWNFYNNTLGNLKLEMPKGSLVVSNNIFWRSDSSGKVSLEGYPDNVVLKNNIIQAKEGYWVVESNNISSDPMFFSEENYDFHLKEQSPAINNGLNEFIEESLEFDLDGNARIVGEFVDIGAYERSTIALHPADTDNDSSISQSEFETYNAAWRTNEDWPTAPTKIPVDFVTRAGYLLQKGGAYKNIGVGKPATWVPVDE
jgi:hypothetical protein